MFEEEEFFSGEEGVAASDEGAQGGGHLQGHEEKNSDPNTEGAPVGGPRLIEHFHQKSGSEEDGDEPDGEDEKAKEGN